MIEESGNSGSLRHKHNTINHGMWHQGLTTQTYLNVHFLEVTYVLRYYRQKVMMN